MDANSLKVVERLSGWKGRYFHSASMTFAHYEFAAGSSIHEHSHPEEEDYEVIEGELELTIDGRSQIAQSGVVAIVPANSRHSVRALSDGRLIVVGHPSRPDFGQPKACTLTPPGVWEPIRRFVPVADNYCGFSGKRSAISDEIAWDAELALPIGPPLHFDDAVKAVAFSPDGRRIAAASAAGMVRIWTVLSGSNAHEGATELVGGAEILSGYRVDDGGSLITVPIGERIERLSVLQKLKTIPFLSSKGNGSPRA